MSHLPLALVAWNTPDFKAVLKQELEQLGVGQLPLQEGLSISSYALDAPYTVLINGVSEDSGSIHTRVGIFYSGIIAGCNCSDDPSPVEPQNEYCEVLVAIDKSTAQASFSLLND
jgi:hypothetical protein